MTKHDLMNHWDEIVTDPRCALAAAEAHLTKASHTCSDAYFIDEYHVVASGGSSGRRGVFVFDWHGWAAQYAAIMRGLVSVAERSSSNASGSFAVVAARIPTHMSSAITQTFSNRTRPIVQAPVTLPLPEIVARLNRARPAILSVYASMLPILCEEAQAGRLQISPALVWSTSEVLLPEARELAEATWRVPVVNAWIASEGPGAIACHIAPGFHIAEDLNIIEPVDEDLNPAPCGERSAKILLTNFSNKLMPLIRYEITDQFQLAAESCACGSAYFKVQDVQGRAEEVFDYGGGVRAHPHIFGSVLGREPSITAYQVRQTANGAEVDVIAPSVICLDRIRFALEKSLTQVGLKGPHVTVRCVDVIQRQASGKLKRYIPLNLHKDWSNESTRARRCDRMQNSDHLTRP